MQKRTTTEFSFVLKPAKHGVGVFAVHDIKKGTPLRLFVSDTSAVKKKREEVPEYFHSYCVARGDSLICPKDFGRMDLGWFLNHSFTPNAKHSDYQYYATKDIKANTEVTIDYNVLEEPEEEKAMYYKK